MKPAVLLCYNLTGEKNRKIKVLAMRHAIRIRAVKPEEYGETLAALCGQEALQQKPQPNEAFTDEMLVLAHFTPDLLNQFLYGFRKNGIAPVALKAMLTDTNAKWDSVELHKELSMEHEAMANGAKPAHPEAGKSE